jgi:pilus assembly protein FimV
MGFFAVNEYITEIELFSMLSKRLPLGALALPLLAALWCGPLRAAELGEVKVNSHIGQQLSADIELVDLTAADLAEIQARLAHPDVFKGAGLSLPPVLSGLYISVAKRDNRRFLHMTTLQPVNSEALHLFLELGSGGRQIIRAATLWLTPEPPPQRVARPASTPATAPMPALAPVPAPAPVAAPPVAKSAPPAPGEAGLSLAAERAFAARKQAAASSPPADVAKAAPAAKPAAPKPTPAPVRAKAPPPAQQAPAPETAPACVPAQVEAQIQQCQAMTGKLVDLEGKVQRLQQAFAAPAPVPAVPAAAAAKPAPAVAKPGAKPGKPGVTAELEAKSRTRMVMLAAGALAGLAALGGAIYFLRKRKGRGPLQIWQSFRKKDATVVAEPTMEEATAQG